MSSVEPVENVDGNAIRAGIKMKDELSEKFLGPGGYFTRLFTIIDVHVLVLIIGIQSGLLNFYILKYNSMWFYYYALFFIDFITIISIIWSILVAKKYYELQDRLENPEYYSDGYDCNPNNSFLKKIIYCRLPKKLFGILPFIYISWLLYTLTLIAKILIIFITDVPNHMLKEDFKLGPQALEMIFALTSIVFLIFICAHRNSESKSHRKLTKQWVDDMINHTVFEIFDSIIFLDLVMPERDHHRDHEVKHDVRNISSFLEYTIICLASANFLIPTINLYHLSKLSACKGKECLKLDLKGKFRHILIHFIRLISVNCAYLIVRVYVSQNYDKAITIFIIKNVLCIIMSFRSLFIEINEYFSTKKKLKLAGSKASVGEGHTHHLTYELQNFASNVGDKFQNGSKNVDKNITNVDNFEDIELK